MRRKVVRGGLLLLNRAGEWRLERQDLWISEGIIEALGPHPMESENEQDVDVIDAAGLLVAPGLINAHYHSHDNLVRGLGPEQPLELWSLAYAGMRDGYTPEEAYSSTLLGCAELLGSGCSAVIDHVRFSPHLETDLLDAVCRAYLDAGMRACVVPVVADRPLLETLPLTAEERKTCGSDVPLNSLTAREQVDRVARLHARWHGAEGLLQVGIGPSGPQRCTDELLRRAAAWAYAEGAPLHMHVLETQLQRTTARKLYGKPMVEHLNELGLLTRRTHLVHMVWASGPELSLVADHGAIVVHNPTSNVRLGSGTAPVPQMLARGIEIALGVDSACCNDSNDLFAAMKWATLIHNLSGPDPETWLRPEQSLAFATQGGASALGGPVRTGELAVGGAADLVFINLSAPGLVPLNAPIRQLVLAAGSRAVAKTMVAGEVVYANDHPTRFDLSALHDAVQELAARRRARYEGHRADPTLEALVKRAYHREAMGRGSADER